MRVDLRVRVIVMFLNICISAIVTSIPCAVSDNGRGTLTLKIGGIFESWVVPVQVLQPSIDLGVIMSD